MPFSSTSARPDAAVESAGQRYLAFARTGDVAILDGLFAEHLVQAYGQARRLLGNTAEAEDVVQEAFLKLVRSAKRYDGSSPFGAWLALLIHHAAMNALRSRGRRRHHEQRARNERQEPVEGTVDEEAVRAAVNELPERYRATVDLHYFAGLSQSHVASALGIKEDAVAKRLERAREYLRSLLQRRGLTVAGSAIALSLATRPSYAVPESLHRLTASSLALTAGVGSSGFVIQMTLAKLIALSGLTLVAGGVWGWNIATHHPAGRPAPRVLASWDFNDGSPPSGWQPYNNFQAWRPVPQAGPDGSTCLQLESQRQWHFCAAVLICERIERVPIEISFKAQFVPVPEAEAEIMPQGPEIFFTLSQAYVSNYPVNGYKPAPYGTWANYRFYITGDCLDAWRDDERVQCAATIPRFGTGLILQFIGWARIDDVVIREIAPHQVPDHSAVFTADQSTMH